MKALRDRLSRISFQALTVAALLVCATTWSGSARAATADAPKAPPTLDQLLEDFQSGMEIDFSNPEHRILFELYRGLKLGDPSKYHASYAEQMSRFERLAKAEKKFPNTQKLPFQDVTVSRPRMSYPRTDKLTALINAQKKAVGQSRGNFFEMEANSGYWMKMRYETGPDSDPQIKNLLTDEDFQKLKAVKTDTLNPYPDLWGKLAEIRAEKLNAGADVTDLSQAMANLVHIYGFEDPLVQEALKSKDGMEQLNGLRRALNIRSDFAETLGFPTGFDGLLEAFNIKKFPGASDAATFVRDLKNAETEVLNKGVKIEGASEALTVRHLSRTESPWRSCLGGDCSTSSYLERALDPNYHYFTLTDPAGHSSGHVTIVLGNAGGQAGVQKVAFVDKIQNIAGQDLPSALEAVRQSVAAQGYQLAIPSIVGDHNGLSNDDVTRAFVSRDLKTYTEQTQVLDGFEPNRTKFASDFLHSRANEKLAVKPLLPLHGTEVEFQVLPPRAPWTASADLKSSEILKSAFALKNGSADDKVRYVNLMRVLEGAGIPTDPEYKSLLDVWAKDPSQPIRLKRTVLGTDFPNGLPEIQRLLDLMTPKERIEILNHWLQTPAMEDLILRFSGDAFRKTFWKTAASHTPTFLKLTSEFGGVHKMSFILDNADSTDPDILKLLDEWPRMIAQDSADGREGRKIIFEVYKKFREVKRGGEHPNLIFQMPLISWFSDPEVSAELKTAVLSSMKLDLKEGLYQVIPRSQLTGIFRSLGRNPFSFPGAVKNPGLLDSLVPLLNDSDPAVARETRRYLGDLLGTARAKQLPPEVLERMSNVLLPHYENLVRSKLAEARLKGPKPLSNEDLNLVAEAGWFSHAHPDLKFSDPQVREVWDQLTVPLTDEKIAAYFNKSGFSQLRTPEEFVKHFRAGGLSPVGVELLLAAQPYNKVTDSYAFTQAAVKAWKNEAPRFLKLSPTVRELRQYMDLNQNFQELVRISSSHLFRPPKLFRSMADTVDAVATAGMKSAKTAADWLVIAGFEYSDGTGFGGRFRDLLGKRVASFAKLDPTPLQVAEYCHAVRTFGAGDIAELAKGQKTGAGVMIAALEAMIKDVPEERRLGAYGYQEAGAYDKSLAENFILAQGHITPDEEARLQKVFPEFLRQHKITPAGVISDDAASTSERYKYIVKRRSKFGAFCAEKFDKVTQILRGQ